MNENQQNTRGNKQITDAAAAGAGLFHQDQQKQQQEQKVLQNLPTQQPQQANNNNNQQVVIPIPAQVCKFEELRGEFVVRREIGRGSYGVVFKAMRNEQSDVDGNGKQKCYAVKRIFPTINAAYILVETLILKLLDGKHNVTDLIQGFRHEGQVSLVFKYQSSKPFLTYLKTLSLVDVKHYMYILLNAVAHLAENGVMHRDIKPNNFLYDPDTRTGLLIDFGLSEIILDHSTQQAVRNNENEQVKKIVQLSKSVKIRNRVGTKGYMPPEAIFNYRNQTSAVDVWACGVIFLSFLAQRHPIFSLNNSSKVKNFTISNLIPFVCLFGSNAVKEIAFKYGYGCLIPDEMQKEPVPWQQICVVQDPQAYDLLEKMLCLDSGKRISAKDALEHNWFDEVRGQVKLGNQFV